LTASFHTSCIELSESGLRKNIRFLKGIIGPRAIFSSVIKGNAYGHCIKTFVPLAEKCGVRHFSVYSAYEAYETFQSRNENSDIMIMGDIDRDALKWAIENEISFFIFSIEWLKLTLEYARQIGKRARIHLELETGLNRTGLQDEQLQQAVDIIKANRENFIVEGVCTHYAGAESVGNYLRIQNQIHSFKEQAFWLARQGIKIGLWHTACSAAALNYPDTVMDMVRFGIAHYGFWPSRETEMNYYLQHNNSKSGRRVDPLKRVMRWKSRVMNVKNVKAGEFVGYGTAYMTTRNQKIASVPVGYFHGFSRDLSNKGYVLVRGRRAAVVGYVNMNILLIDVTDFPEVYIGDEVVIIGKQKNRHISVGYFSDLGRFLNYEVLVRLPAEIPRIVVD